MDKSNQKTNNLLDGLEFLKENGIDLDAFYSIDLLSPIDEIVMHGSQEQVSQQIDILESIGFIHNVTGGLMTLMVRAGKIKIVIG